MRLRRRRGRSGSGRSRAVEGIGRHVAHRLLADGEHVVDVPSEAVRPGAGVRHRARPQDRRHRRPLGRPGRHPDGGLRPVVNDEQLEPCCGSWSTGAAPWARNTPARCQPAPRILLLELIPGGAKKDLSAAQAKAAGRGPPTRRGGQDPQTSRGRTGDRPRADLHPQEGRGQGAQGSGRRDRHLPAWDLHGIGPSGAARLLVEVGDITRFPDQGNHFASWTGTAPIDASSGDHVRHRLSRGGNRQINRVLHIMATVQLRTRTTEGRAYFDRKRAAARPPWKPCAASNAACPTSSTAPCSTTTPRHMATGPGGQRGNDSDSSAAGSQPHTQLRTSHFPDPPPPILEPPSRPPLDTEGSHVGLGLS
jgi:transposase